MKGITDVYESALKLLVPHSVEETYATVVNQAMDLVNAKHGSIFVPSNDNLKRVYTSTKKLYKLKPRKESAIYEAFNNNVSILRPGKDLAKVYPEFKKNPVGSDILIPLTYGHITIGTLSVMSAPDKQWGDDELNLLRIFSPIATLAIRSAQLKRELTNALDMRDLFISMAAHELKTPITSIHLHAQIIEKAIKKNKKPNTEPVETLVKETNRLTRLINELMDVAHIQQGKLRYNMKKCNLVAVLKNTLNDYLQEHEQYEFKYNNKTNEKKLYIKGDKDKLRQVFSNILNNSIKFSEKNSTIRTIVSKEKDHVIITIKDQGAGISEDEMPHIFERYYRGSGSTDSRKGIGLGLSLVKSIVEEHQGEITVESEKNKGTSVIIKFPMYKENNDK